MAEILKRSKVKLDRLVPDDGNRRVHDARNIKTVRTSLETFGQYRPFVVDEGWRIAVGNGMREAMLEIREGGGNKFATVEVVQMSLTPEEFRRLSRIDNRSAELADWDTPNLLADLRAIMETDGEPGLEDEGWTGHELDELAAMSETPPPDPGGSTDPAPEVVFSEVLGEANNYIVLVFDTDIDWLAAMEHFKLETRTSKRQNGKPWSRGIGRVVDGGKYLTDLTGEEGVL